MENANDKRLFWACFIALIATAFGFIVRIGLMEEWANDFGLTQTQIGQISGIGMWPFAVSIILFSLIIDKIGYGKAMAFAFFAHIAYAVIILLAPTVLADKNASPEEIEAGKQAGYWMLFFGSLIFALGNGTVEAVINPVVATMFRREKTKWLNILHAGWPGGLVLAGLLIILIGSFEVPNDATSKLPWQYKVVPMFIPVIIYGIMMIFCRFPTNERVEAGSSYKDMLREFGAAGALIVTGLIVWAVTTNLQEAKWIFQDKKIWETPNASLQNLLPSMDWVFTNKFFLRAGITLAVAIAFGVYTRSLGRPMFIFLLLIMIPLATTEIGTDNWIGDLMKPAMEKIGRDGGWILVYTSFIMLVLRFFAGPIVHRISPLGLLAVSAAIAAVGLYSLSMATGAMIFAAATLYGFGKTFFWPTMLGVVAEQFPKGGALTLNATGGVGMLGVGVVGAVFIGLIQDRAVSRELHEKQPALYAQIVEKDKDSIFGKYEAVSADKKQTLPKDEQTIVNNIEAQAKQQALAVMAIFPCIMLVCYLVLIAYFRAKGGYKAQVLTGHAATDEKFTGGVEGPGEA